MYDTELLQPTDTVVAAIESLRPARDKPAAYDTPEGVLFRKALALIENPLDWTCKSTGRDGNSRCSIYALFDIDGGQYSNAYLKIFDALSVSMGNDDITVFNDTHTHAEVIAKWHEVGHANGWL